MSDTEGKSSLTCLLAIAEAEASKLEDENDRLRTENSELWELVCDMALWLPKPIPYEFPISNKFKKYMRKMGIVVGDYDE